MAATKKTSEPGVCPKCGKELSWTGAVEYDDNEASWPVWCKACGFTGYEVNALKFAGYVDDEDRTADLL